jgi:hypothetical protein
MLPQYCHWVFTQAQQDGFPPRINHEVCVNAVSKATAEQTLIQQATVDVARVNYKHKHESPDLSCDGARGGLGLLEEVQQFSCVLPFHSAAIICWQLWRRRYDLTKRVFLVCSCFSKFREVTHQHPFRLQSQLSVSQEKLQYTKIEQSWV